MPTISNGGRTITVHIRNGVRFSPPVNRVVTTSDVKYAIERAFDTSVANGYVAAYFGDLVGAPTTPPNHVPNIRGIQTPNKTTIVFKLRRPSGAFEGALGLLVTAPVPPGYARPFDSKTVSDYGLHQVATGPYMIKNNASGSINGIGYQPNKLIDLVRNPNWNAKTSWRPANANEILFKEGFQDPTVMTREVLAGTADVNGDTPPPPAELRSIMASSSKGRLFFTPTGGSRYIALNTREAPFKPELRQQGLHTGRRLCVQPVPEQGLQRQRRQGEGADEGGWLPHRLVHRARADAGGGQHAARLQHGTGRRGRSGQDRHQAQDDLGDARDDVHALLQRPEERTEHLPERRLAPRLPRAAGDSRRAVQRQEHHVVEQLELAALERPGDQQGDGPGRADRQPAGALRRLGPDRQDGHQHCLRDPLDLGSSVRRCSRAASPPRRSSGTAAVPT
jgi:hypothetical protein